MHLKGQVPEKPENSANETPRGLFVHNESEVHAASKGGTSDLPFEVHSKRNFSSLAFAISKGLVF